MVQKKTSKAKASSKPDPTMAWLRNCFSLDLRSLALFRVMLGCIIIADLIDRGGDLRAHYTDFGLLARGPLIDHFINGYAVCLYLITGSWGGVLALFILQGLIACLLIVGVRTRVMITLSWIMMHALHLRNPMVLQGGDDLLRMLMFWAMFTPLGACYSVDAALSKKEGGAPPPNTVLSPGTFALVGQVLLLYWSTAVLKTGVEWHAEGSAVYYALSFEQLTTSFGMWLRQFAPLLPILTHVTLVIESLGPFLFISPVFFGPLRTLGALMFTGMHHSFALCLMLGLFPYIDMASMMVLLPDWFWQRAGRLIKRDAQQAVTVFYDGDCDVCKKFVLIIREFLILPHVGMQIAQSEAAVAELMRSKASWVVRSEGALCTDWPAFVALCRVSPLARPFARFLAWRPIAAVGRRAYYAVAGRRGKLGPWTALALPWRPLRLDNHRVTKGVVLLLFGMVINWNIAAWPGSQIRFPDALRQLAYFLRLDQDWGMFAPYPQKDDGWYVMTGRLVDGSEVDVFRHEFGKPTLDKPALVSAMYPNQRWSKYMMNIWLARNADYRLYLGQYLCRFWNTAANVHEPKSLHDFDIVYMREDNLPDYKVKPAEKVVLWQHRCFDDKPAATK